MEGTMAKYLVHASYTSEGAKGVIAEGGSGRQDAIAKVASELGGSLECFYFAFGSDDVVTILDLPDNASALAVAMTVAASGLVSIRTTVLVSTDEVDEAARKSVGYRGPGQ
jgi:uncharacterized protein with GYD domain